MSKNDLEKWWEQTQNLLEAKGFQVFPQLPDGEGWRAHWGEAGVEEFLELALKLEIRLMYAVADRFSESNIDELKAKLLGEVDDDEELDIPAFQQASAEILLPPEVTQILRRAEKDIGKITYTALSWFYAGVNHTFIRQADWHAELEAQVAELAFGLEEKRAEEREQERLQRGEQLQRRRAVTREFAEQLSLEPEFQTAKGEYAGRILVAKRFFPKLDETMPDGDNPSLDAVVEMAWTIYRTLILPEQERKLASEARSLLSSGLTKAETARRLEISPKRLDGLLSRNSSKNAD